MPEPTSTTKWHENLIIESPRHWKGEFFRGETELRFNARGDAQKNVFEDCVFEGRGRIQGTGGSYALHVQDRWRPHARFQGCEFYNADKGIFGNFVGAYDCEFHHLADGVMVNLGGYVHVEGGRMHTLGGFEDDHADGVQISGGTHLTVRNVFFDLIDKREDGIPYWTNSCVIIETFARRIDNVNIDGNRMRGGTKLVYVLEDRYGNGAPTNVRLRNNDGAGWKSAPVYWNTHKARPIQIGNSWPGGKRNGIRHGEGVRSIEDAGAGDVPQDG